MIGSFEIVAATGYWGTEGPKLALDPSRQPRTSGLWGSYMAGRQCCERARHSRRHERPHRGDPWPHTTNGRSHVGSPVRDSIGVAVDDIVQYSCRLIDTAGQPQLRPTLLRPALLRPTLFRPTLLGLTLLRPTLLRLILSLHCSGTFSLRCGGALSRLQKSA